jgi:hypothetical protein
MYQFYPPFFIVNEETNFPDSWEVFCCKLLNLENKTSNIIRRLPPENGVDLFFPHNKIAYQCKSVETGLTSGFNLTKIRNSYESALTIKSTLGWEKYVVCVNTDLTGTQYDNFTRALPNVTILTKSYWTNLCQKFSVAVQENFRKLITISSKVVEERITENFYSNYSDSLKSLLKKDQFDLIFYSNRHDSVYRIPVSKKFKINDLLHILRGIFKLPPAKKFSGGVEVSISYSIVNNDKKVPLNKTIEEAGIDENSVITLWLTMIYSENNERASSLTKQMITQNTMKRIDNPVDYALDEYKSLITQIFIKADEELLRK